MGDRMRGLRGRGVRLAVAGVAATGMAIGGVAVAGAAPAAPVAPAPAAVVAAPAVAPAAAGGVTTQAASSRQYDVYYNLKPTARYPQTVFSEVTNEGKFARIFPVKGAKANLGRVGTRHNLTVLGKPWPVRVSVLGSTTWRFDTLPGHPKHPGTVQFWLYKKGDMMKLHVRGICKGCGAAAYKAGAYAQWIKFAANIKMNVRL